MIGIFVGIKIGGSRKKKYFLASFDGTLGLTVGTGPVTYARASSIYVADNTSVLRKMDSGVAGYSGLRVSAINSILNSATEASYVFTNGTGLGSFSGEDAILYSLSDGVRPAKPSTTAGESYVVSVELEKGDDISTAATLYTFTGADIYANVPTSGISHLVLESVTGNTYSSISIQGINNNPNPTKVKIKNFQLCPRSVIRHPAGIDTIVCVGDSITANYGYPEYLQKVFFNSTVVNAGIDGNRTDQVDDRFATDVAVHSPDVVCLLIGFNDINTGYTLAHMQEHVSSVLAKTAAINANMVLINMLPSGAATGWTEANQSLWVAYTDWLKTLSVYKFIDLVPLLREYGTTGMQVGLSTDGVHPRAEAAHMISMAVADALGVVYPPILSTTTVTRTAFSAYEADGTPIPSTGIDIYPLSTNLCTCWGFPRADSYGSTLVAGTATKGKIYEIVARVALDWGAVATLVSGTANTVGAKYLITGVLTFTATETGKECIDYVGTKAYSGNLTTITGMTLSGATDAVVSIVQDSAGIAAMTTDKLARVVDQDKVYKCLTGVLGAATVTYTGAMSAVPTSISEFVRVISGSCVISDSTGTYTVTPSGSGYTRYKKENFTPTAGATMKIVVAASSNVNFLIPQVESKEFCSPVNPSVGVTSTRLSCDISAPMTGNYPLTGRRHIPKLEWTPRGLAAGLAQCLWHSGTDTTLNYVALWATGSTEVKLEKRVAGVSEFATLIGAFVVGTTYAIDPGFNSDNTMFLLVDNVAAGVNTSTTLAPIFGTAQWFGSQAATKHMAGQLRNVTITQ